MKPNPLVLSLFLLAAAACDKGAGDVEALETEVMAIHDEVMPKMEDIVNVKKRLSARVAELDSLQQEGVTSTTFAEERMKALALAQDLTTADSLMMEWMHQYRGDSARALPSGDALVYFRLEKDKILDVQRRTNESLERARDFLE